MFYEILINFLALIIGIYLGIMYIKFKDLDNKIKETKLKIAIDEAIMKHTNLDLYNKLQGDKIK